MRTTIGAGRVLVFEPGGERGQRKPDTITRGAAPRSLRLRAPEINHARVPGSGLWGPHRAEGLEPAMLTRRKPRALSDGPGCMPYGRATRHCGLSSTSLLALLRSMIRDW